MGYELISYSKYYVDQYVIMLYYNITVTVLDKDFLSIKSLKK